MSQLRTVARRDDLADEPMVPGAAWMAGKIDQPIGLSLSPGTPVTRRCKA